MASLILFLLFIVLFVVILMLSFVGNIVQRFLSLFKRPSSENDEESREKKRNRHHRTPRNKEQKGKVFEQSDGEYVDFVEYKKEDTENTST